jgi:predicted ATP-dependent serine protease
MKTFSVCINCGVAKRKPMNKCAKCGFKPQSDEEKAKSLILSIYYEINDEYRGKTMEELEAIAIEIQKGVTYEFVAEEVRSVIAYAHQVMAIPARQLIIDGLKWIVPPVVILLIINFLF